MGTASCLGFGWRFLQENGLRALLFPTQLSTKKVPVRKGFSLSLMRSASLMELFNCHISKWRFLNLDALMRDPALNWKLTHSPCSPRVIVGSQINRPNSHCWVLGTCSWPCTEHRDPGKGLGVCLPPTASSHPWSRGGFGGTWSGGKHNFNTDGRLEKSQSAEICFTVPSLKTREQESGPSSLLSLQVRPNSHFFAFSTGESSFSPVLGAKLKK